MESAQVAHHDHGDFDGFTSFLWQIIEADNKVHDFVKAAQSKGYKVGEDALKDAKSLLLYIAKVNTVHTTQNAVRNIMEEIGYDYSKLYTAYRSKVEEHSGSDSIGKETDQKKSGSKENACHLHGRSRNLHCKDCNAVLCKSCIDESHVGHDWDVWNPSENIEVMTYRIKDELERCTRIHKLVRQANKESQEEQRNIADKILQSKQKAISDIENHAKSAVSKCDSYYRTVSGRLSNDLKTLKEHEGLLHSIQNRLKQNDITAVEDAMQSLWHDEFDSIEHSLEYVTDNKVVFDDNSTVSLDIFGRLFIPDEDSSDSQTQRPLSRMSVSSDLYDENLTFVKRFLPIKAYVSVVRPAVRKGIYFKNHHKSMVYSIDETSTSQKEEVNLQSLTSGDFCPFDGGFVFSDFEKKQIRFASPKAAAIRDLYNSDPFIPLGIHISLAMKVVFVGFTDSFSRNLTEKSRRFVKTFVIQKTEMKEKKKIFEKTANGERLLRYPYRLTYNNSNNTLCVVDQTSDKSGRVVVLDVDPARGIVGSFEGLQIPPTTFDPRGICVNSAGQILVTDTNNHSVHLLTSEARYIRTMFSYESGFQFPRAVAINEKELWIGCQSGIILLFKFKD
ncbi:hypothetical protein FSP39_015590 [Pinctada imbricata]|uniref:B box-type domain-containing protein n=1 Tax=Pinctada imbricata TaxID=66713 RepID=A0AA89C5H5_PINIB|nr:hypothetical protein FSP39_015590 [Pinctada imbricata]